MDSTQIVIVGANGQLGKALQVLYPDAKSLGSEALDITDRKAVDDYDWSGMTTIINAAAFTNVDGAESAEGRISAWEVNAVGPANLARVAREHNLTLVHISSDYVFDGSHDTHTEYEAFSPLGVYGQTKAAGDIAVSLAPKHYILRTSWVIGDGKNFVRTMLGVGQKGINPSVVSDQIGRLTFTTDLAAGIDHLLKNNAAPGTYNLSNDGEPTSWSGITRAIYEITSLGNTVTDVTTADYFRDKPDTSPRPLHSTLDLAKIKATGFTPTDWKTALKAYLEKEQTA